MKGKLIAQYTEQIIQALDAGQKRDSVDIKLKLSIIKPLHAKWVIELYKEMTSGDGREVCLKGWELYGIKQAVEMELSNLPQLDLFEDIDLMFKGDADMKSIGPSSILEASKYLEEVGNMNDSDSDSNLNPLTGNL